MEMIPKDLRTARACLFCSLIKTFDQFEFDGCDNCDAFLRMKNNRDNVYDCTSSNFDGMIALMSPEDSWVAKWQRINRLSRGIYAISVAGRLPKGVLQDLKRRGIVYKPRDTSMRHCAPVYPASLVIDAAEGIKVYKLWDPGFLPVISTFRYVIIQNNNPKVYIKGEAKVWIQ